MPMRLSTPLALCASLAPMLFFAVADGAPTSEPVFVTDYLPDRFLDGQRASAVNLTALGWSEPNAMHSGFITLDKKLGRNTFFWYSEALDRNASAPLLLWLQGGPGASSLFGMFTEVGPFSVGPGGVIKKRDVSWNENYHMLFLDNPVGAGFSFTDTVEGFITSHEEAGRDLHTALRQFFQLFPHLRANDFYVTGESYAGKWVPSCAYNIHMGNMDPASASTDRINLKGIAIGDGAMHPAKQFQGFGDLLWNLGMADENERQVFKKYEAQMQERLSAGDPTGAFEAFDEMLNGDFYPYPTYYANVTGMTSNYFNFELSPDATPLGGDFVDWLNTPAVRSEIHVGQRAYAPANDTTEAHLKPDWMRDVVAMLVPLMENYKVVIYSGQNDIILGPALTEQFLRELDWSGKQAYVEAQKVVWRRTAKGPGSKLADVAGYARQVGQFSQVVVRGAGHMVPGDQPERARDLIDRFVAGQQFGDVSTPAASAPAVGSFIV
eukprot:TRINITY_DN18574_c0_g6_i1.p1 TRINITY_DN18574_c0_g6~~TRINITY_DN18574_c0_g6_i1.p1  ORF type:complete len:514 (+),score=93.21 TRINITY_DN18574_c0_g6_i1:63-1544(+)